MNFVCDLFWASVRVEFPELDLTRSIGIRRNWKVVLYDDEDLRRSGQKAMIIESIVIPSSFFN